MSGQPQTLATLALGNAPPLNRKVGRPHSLPGHFGEDKYVLPLLEFEPHIILPVAWSLHQLCYPVYNFKK